MVDAKKLLISLFNVAMQDCLSKILELLGEESGKRLLDCGCGDGELTVKVAKVLGATNTYGVDIDEEILSIAVKRGIKAFKADLNLSLPFKDNFFDVIISNQVTEHLDQPDNFVKEVLKVLKPGGYAIVASENLASWHNIFALLIGYQGFSSQGPSSEYRIGNPLSPYYMMKISRKGR